MTKRLDLIGQTFGRLLVIRFDGFRRDKGTWKCLCSCGALCSVQTDSLRGGFTKSCGCLRAEITGALKRSHQKSARPEFGIWTQMKMRCVNPKNKRYANYGGRGITVCKRWHNFEHFYADMGPRPSPKHSIERVNNDGNYEPSNCVWLLMNLQTANRQNTVKVTYKNQTHHLSEWARILGTTDKTIKCRWLAGKPLENPKG